MFEIFTFDFEEFLDFRNEPEIKEVLFEKKRIPLSFKRRIDELFLEYITY
jgi:predicted AAA+ superfamily ATPase